MTDINPAALARNLLVFDKTILDFYKLSIQHVQQHIAVEPLGNAYIADNTPPIPTQSKKRLLIWEIRRRCALMHPDDLLAINYALIEVKQTLKDLHIDWINYAPLTAKGRLLFAPSLVRIARPSGSVYFILVPLAFYRDLYVVRSLLSRWNRLNKKITPPQPAVVLIVKHWHPEETIWSVDPVAELFSGRSNTTIHIVERRHLAAGIRDLAATHLRLATHYAPPYTDLPTLRTTSAERYAKITHIPTTLDMDEIRWLRVLEAFHNIPAHLSQWGWRLTFGHDTPPPLCALKTLLQKGLVAASPVTVNGNPRPLLSLSLSEHGIIWLALHDLADPYRTSLYYRFFVKHNQRRYLHLLSSYYAIARLHTEISRHHALGWSWRVRRAYGEYLASHSYRPEVRTQTVLTYRPDGMLVLEDANGSLCPLHLEIDGWRLGAFGLQRSRFFKEHWEKRFKSLLAYFRSGEWRMRFPQFPIILYISENYTQSLAAAQTVIAPILGTLQQQIPIYISPWTAFQSPRNGVHARIWHEIYNPEKIASLHEILERHHATRNP